MSMSTVTTLATAKAANDLQITLASAVGVVPGMLVRIGAEKLRITRVDRAPTLGVVPGYDGTTAQSHLALSKVTFGLPHEFAVVDYSNVLQVRAMYTAIEDGISTAGRGLPAIRAAAHFVGLTAAVPSLTSYTPLVDTTLNVMVSILITTSSAEAFTIFVSYTDTGGTARVATLPLRLLTGVNVLAVAFANGAIPYAGVTQQFRARAGTLVTLGTTGTFTGATYDCSAVILDSQTGENPIP
jgi:hypothetical protein